MTATSDRPPPSEELADTAAPLDALLVDAALGPLRRFAPGMSTAKLAAGLARRPVTTGRRLGGLAAELMRVAPGRRSWRRPGATAGSPIQPGQTTRCCAGSCSPTWRPGAQPVN